MRKYSKNVKDRAKFCWYVEHPKIAPQASLDFSRKFLQRVRRTLSQPAKKPAI